MPATIAQMEDQSSVQKLSTVLQILLVLFPAPVVTFAEVLVWELLLYVQEVTTVHLVPVFKLFVQLVLFVPLARRILSLVLQVSFAALVMEP